MCLVLYFYFNFISINVLGSKLQGTKYSLAIYGTKYSSVQDRIISDMVSTVELERPRLVPIKPEWDLDIVLEAFSKQPNDPLQKASLKHHTCRKSLAMASAGRLK